MASKYFDNFIDKYSLSNTLNEGDMVLILMDELRGELVKIHPFEPELGFPYRDVVDKIADSVFWRMTWNSLYIGQIIDGDFVAKLYADYQFLFNAVVLPGPMLLGLQRDEEKIKEYIVSKINEHLDGGEGDFVTINMLTKYFVLDRSNIHRFRHDGEHTLGLDKGLFLLSFLNRHRVELNWGEIKRLISLNCIEPDILQKALKLSKIKSTTRVFLNTIEDRGDLTYSVTKLKDVLAHYRMIELGDMDISRKRLAYKHKLEFTPDNSFKKYRKG